MTTATKPEEENKTVVSEVGDKAATRRELEQVGIAHEKKIGVGRIKKAKVKIKKHNLQNTVRSRINCYTRKI
jgi:hypothetical protein